MSPARPHSRVRVGVITGAAGGIGTALCRVFRSAGYRTIGVDRGAARPDCDAFIEIDLERLCADPSYRDDATRRLTVAVGGARLDVLVNNAAVQILGSSEELTAADWQRTLSVNVLAPFLLTQALLARLEAAHGSVVNVSSIHASATKPGFVAYATSKAALVGLTRSMAVDLGARIRVNAVCPAAVATPMLLEGFKGNRAALDELAGMHPAGRIGTPEEVAHAALFLASQEAGFISGAVLGVDGGIGGRLHDPA
jgi:NAD(P)-dependent dehydrogenase (short-subunit alcohol dehydrogenase family)